MDNLYSILTKNIPEENIYLNEPMKKHTSFKIGGNADIFIRINKIEELKYILKVVKIENVPLTIIGNGTNILVRDNGIRGIVAKICIQKVQIEDRNEEVFVTLGAGELLGKISQIFLKNSIEGFEFASGIPGTIGGAIRMNAGAYGGEFKDIVESVTYMDEMGEIKTIKNKDCEFDYRHSLFSDKNYIIIQAILKLKKGNKKEIKAKMDDYAESRKTKQPITVPSAGSTFKRGEDFITAKLIDECGLKGYSVGDAEVSTLHAGFIVNKGNATASDILKLIEHVKCEVFKKFNKKIELEIEVLGE